MDVAHTTRTDRAVLGPGTRGALEPLVKDTLTLSDVSKPEDQILLFDRWTAGPRPKRAALLRLQYCPWWRRTLDLRLLLLWRVAIRAGSTLSLSSRSTPLCRRRCHWSNYLLLLLLTIIRPVVARYEAAWRRHPVAHRADVAIGEGVRLDVGRQDAPLLALLALHPLFRGAFYLRLHSRRRDHRSVGFSFCHCDLSCGFFSRHCGGSGGDCVRTTITAVLTDLSPHTTRQIRPLAVVVLQQLSPCTRRCERGERRHYRHRS